MSTAAIVPLAFLSFLSGEPELPKNCPASPPPAVDVIALVPGYLVAHDKSRTALGAMIGKKAFPGFYTQGVTDVTYGSRMRLKLATSRLADGRWCAAARAVEVEFGLTAPAQVHIASEIPVGGCRYQTVLAHEMRHVEISQRAATEAVEEVRTTLSSRLAVSPMEHGIDEASASAALQAALQGVVDDTTKARIASAEIENAMIDTPASYEELKNQCPGSSE